MKGITICALLSVCLVPATMLAQQSPSVRYAPVGVHTRITATTSSKPFVLDVSSDTPVHVVRDVVVGTIGGAAIGALIGYSTNKHSNEDRQLAALSGGILGAGVGAIVGAVVGFTHKGER